MNIKKLIIQMVEKINDQKFLKQIYTLLKNHIKKGGN